MLLVQFTLGRAARRLLLKCWTGSCWKPSGGSPLYSELKPEELPHWSLCWDLTVTTPQLLTLSWAHSSLCPFGPPAQQLPLPETLYTIFPQPSSFCSNFPILMRPTQTTLSKITTPSALFCYFLLWYLTRYMIDLIILRLLLLVLMFQEGKGCSLFLQTISPALSNTLVQAFVEWNLNTAWVLKNAFQLLSNWKQIMTETEINPRCDSRRISWKKIGHQSLEKDMMVNERQHEFPKGRSWRVTEVHLQLLKL